LSSYSTKSSITLLTVQLGLWAWDWIVSRSRGLLILNFVLLTLPRLTQPNKSVPASSNSFKTFLMLEDRFGMSSSLFIPLSIEDLIITRSSSRTLDKGLIAFGLSSSLVSLGLVEILPSSSGISPFCMSLDSSGEVWWFLFICLFTFFTILAWTLFAAIVLAPKDPIFPAQYIGSVISALLVLVLYSEPPSVQAVEIRLLYLQYLLLKLFHFRSLLF
jgi:hypothetical protein